MNRALNPTAIAPPDGRYDHAVEVPPNARWLHIAGQTGVAPDGTVPASLSAQVENCWRNIKLILAEAGMTVGDLVKVTIFLTQADDIDGYREARDRIVGEVRPASSLVIVSRLVMPELRVEVEAIAAKA